MIKEYSLTVKINGYNVVVYTPDDYTSSKKYKAFVFVPGKGETGTTISALYKNGPLFYIKPGWKPPFIVVAIQPKKDEWISAASIFNVMTSIEALYSLEEKFSISGLSLGGWAALNFAGMGKEYAKKIDAIISFSAPVDQWDTKNFAGIRAWGIHGSNDNSVNIDSHENFIKSIGGRFTKYAGGHSGWNKFYDPNWKENGESIYDFAMKGVVAPPVDPPPPPPVDTKPKVLYELYTDFTYKKIS